MTTNMATKQPAMLAWWTRVTLLFIALTAAFPATLLALAANNYRIESSAQYQLLALAGALSLSLAIVWMCWVCPVLRAASPLVKYAAMNPRKYLHSLQGPVWVPVLVVIALTVASMWYVRVPGMSQHVFKAIRQTGPAPYLAALTASLMISWLLHIWVRRRLRRALAMHHLCPQCGYDLHATDASACSECGARREDLPTPQST